MTGQIVGYIRVSSAGQDYDTQLKAVLAAGASDENVFREKQSGASADDRPQLQALLKYVRAGDTVVITKIDRLARSVRDLQNIVHSLKLRGVGLHIIDQGCDVTKPAGKLFMDIIGAVAEFERTLLKERQAVGIAAAKLKKRYKGRKPTIGNAAVLDLAAQGLGHREVARKLGISRSSVYRIVKKAEDTGAEAAAGSRLLA
jgi:DNA invertase Pin-like site-specific DNA recombinase